MLRRFTITLLIPFLCFGFSGSFKKEQLKYSNVKTAYKEKWALVKDKLQKAGVDTSHFEVFLRVFKKEAEVEVWTRSKNATQFKLVDTYTICRSSGELGPKRQQGDMQVPEGFYTVSIYQPNSAYYLALGISYPNKSDRIKGNKTDPGGEIMIHGNCVTIGCMPLTDDKIKEVYIMAIEAHNNGQLNVPVHIFPTRMTDDGMKWLKDNIKDAGKLAFWENIRDGFTYFDKNKTLPSVSVSENGDYKFQ